MSRFDARKAVDEIVKLSTEVESLRPEAVRKLSEWRAGYPGGNDGGGGKGGHSDRTQALAMKGTDPFTRDLALLDAALELALGGLRQAHRLCLVATQHEVADPALPGCRSCARLLNFRNVPTYSPVHPGCQLCQFCQRWVDHENNPKKEWPPVKAVEIHERGNRISEQERERFMAGRSLT